MTKWTNRQLVMIMANTNVSAKGRKAAAAELAKRSK